MSSYSYIDTTNVNLVCCICRSPFLDPCTTRTCCHTFCYDCIAQAIAVSRQCPIDRCPLSMHDLAPADPVVRNLVDELIVECPQRAAGCMYTCQRLLLAAHLKDACEFVETVCPDGLRDQRVLRKDAAAHAHTHDSEGARNDGVESTKSETSTASGSTPGNPSLTHVPGPGADDALATENTLLRLRLSALEGVVNSLRYEMRGVQCALGPWYRPEDANRASPEAHVEGQISAAASRGAFDGGAITDAQPQLSNTNGGATRGLTSPLSSPHVAASPSALTPSMPLDPAGLDLAMYFPPAEEASIYTYAVPSDPQTSWQALPLHQAQAVFSQPASGTQRSHPSPAQPHPGPHSAPPYPFPSYQSGHSPHTSAFSPTAPYPHSYPGPSPSFTPNALSVPPLDPTTPLPNTLASLHATLGTLAGALGALASARAAEALHTGEEIRGVRAGMHGLRLQLHDVMTHLARDPSASASASAPDGPAPGGGPGAPAWMAYGPRAFGAMQSYAYPGKPSMPTSVTKL
ncbi:hypothetical protein B0H21DRAFT_795394 [Amylocystis lapponica]|nr:hypothetical protein B0H21DRAFT_795394 [Amylocystis lapponica]